MRKKVLTLKLNDSNIITKKSQKRDKSRKRGANMTNTQMLKGKIVEKNLTQRKLAELVNISRASFYRKIKTGGNDFSIGEALKIAKILSLTRDEASSIFFNSIVAKTRHSDTV